MAQDLQIAGFQGTSLPASPAWVSATLEDDDHAAVRCTAAHAQTYVLLFAHTTVVDSPETEALQLLYPFLCPPMDQTLATVQAGVAGPIVWENPGQSLAVPAVRVRKHLQEFLNAPTLRPSFGPLLANTNPTVFAHDPLVWRYGSRADERESWQQPWSDANRVFDVSAVGRAALGVAAYSAVEAGELGGLDAVQEVMANEFGYRIHIQALYVTFEGGVKIRASQSAVAYRRSLREVDPGLGPIPAFPSVFDPNHWVYAAKRGGLAHVMFPHSVQNMAVIAWFETSTGWVASPQIPNPNGLEPERARFAFPINAVSGFAYFMTVPVLEGSPIWLNPLHAYGVATPQNPVLPASMFALE